MDGQSNGQAQINVPLQLLRSWGHKNIYMFKLRIENTKNGVDNCMGVLEYLGASRGICW